MIKRKTLKVGTAVHDIQNSKYFPIFVIHTPLLSYMSALHGDTIPVIIGDDFTEQDSNVRK
jgi:hypothetical protein